MDKFKCKRLEESNINYELVLNKTSFISIFNTKSQCILINTHKHIHNIKKGAPFSVRI